MKVLVLSSTYPRWADDTLPAFVHQLSRRLVERGVEIDVLTPHLPGTRTVEKMDGVHIRRFRYGPELFEVVGGPGGILGRARHRPWRALALLPFLLCFAWTLWWQLRRQHYAVIHAHWLIPQGLLACLLVRAGCDTAVPILCTAHGGDVFGLRGALFSRIRKWIGHRATYVTAVSNFMRETLIDEGLPASRVDVISMGVDLEHSFAPQTDIARDPWGLIFVGRLVEKKGVRYLLDAMASLSTEFPAAYLTIIGEGPERSMLEERGRAHGVSGRIKFLGAQPPRNLRALYSAAAIAVVPSIVDQFGDQEGLGLVTIEAMGCGCAVVASDLAAIRDVVKHNHNGLLATPQSPASLAAEIKKLLLNPGLRTQLSAQARRDIPERFGWTTVTAQYAELLDMVSGAIKN